MKSIPISASIEQTINSIPSEISNNNKQKIPLRLKSIGELCANANEEAKLSK